MPFTSPRFLFFLLIVLGVYFAAPLRLRWVLLLVASYVYYMSWQPAYGLLLFAATFVGYAGGLCIANASGRCRRFCCWTTVACSLALLSVFKYYDVLKAGLELVLGSAAEGGDGPVVQLAFPVGISFYTFLVIGYTIEVYRGKLEPERNLGRLALYVGFFPYLVAGPIGRPQALLPQFRAGHPFDPEMFARGLRLVAWGLVKKLVIADRLALVVNTVYENPTNYSGVPLLVATVLFAVQIYCDFSGYSDIAVGVARTMGYDLAVNFRQPYFSTSISGFWQRWHVSLSTWLRDYLFLPLAYGLSRRVQRDSVMGLRSDLVIYLAAMFVTMMACGAWHGVGATFLLWGAWHATCLAVHRAWSTSRLRWVKRVRRLPLWPLLAWALTFLSVCGGWVLFRANSASDARYIFGHVFTGIRLQSGYGLNVGGAYEAAILAAALAILFFIDAMEARGGIGGWFDRRPLMVRWAAYYAACFGILIFGEIGTTEFIYFQF